MENHEYKLNNEGTTIGNEALTTSITPSDNWTNSAVVNHNFAEAFTDMFEWYYNKQAKSWMVTSDIVKSG